MFAGEWFSSLMTHVREFITELSLLFHPNSDAALMSMRRKIVGKSPAEIKLIKREEVDLPVTADDFKEAISKTRKSVSEADVKNFENWMGEYGSC